MTASLTTCHKCVIALGRRFVIARTMAESGNAKKGILAEDISSMRIKYKDKHELFLESSLVSKEPIGQFKAWFDYACSTPTVNEPNAMCLATASKDGIPSARYVLLKSYDKDGFVFFTNKSSRKGKDLEANPNAALTFYWEPLKRSVRIEGPVVHVPDSEAEEYFHSRPRDSQIGACASHQSEIISGRDELSFRVQQLTAQFADKTVPKPPEWGGYKLVPVSVEFWQGQSDRVHDRIRFRRVGNGPPANEQTTFSGQDGWLYERLSP